MGTDHIAMIAGEQDDGIIPLVGFLKGVKHAAYLFVNVAAVTPVTANVIFVLVIIPHIEFIADFIGTLGGWFSLEGIPMVVWQSNLVE
jgi:hypothetical protein